MTWRSPDIIHFSNLFNRCPYFYVRSSFAKISYQLLTFRRVFISLNDTPPTRHHKSPFHFFNLFLVFFKMLFMFCLYFFSYYYYRVPFPSLKEVYIVVTWRKTLLNQAKISLLFSLFLSISDICQKVHPPQNSPSKCKTFNWLFTSWTRIRIRYYI
jgi:hypothetical protein